jgi:hypothetical protein
MRRLLRIPITDDDKLHHTIELDSVLENAPERASYVFKGAYSWMLYARKGNDLIATDQAGHYGDGDLHVVVSPTMIKIGIVRERGLDFEAPRSGLQISERKLLLFTENEALYINW